MPAYQRYQADKTLSALIEAGLCELHVQADEAAKVIAQSDDAVEKDVLGLAASAADGIEEKTLVQLLKYLDIDLARHWKLCGLS